MSSFAALRACPERSEGMTCRTLVWVTNLVTSSVYQHRRPPSEQRMDLRRELPFFPVATMLVNSGGYEVGNPYSVLHVILSTAKDLASLPPRSFAVLRMTCLISKYLPLAPGSVLMYVSQER